MGSWKIDEKDYSGSDFSDSDSEMGRPEKTFNQINRTDVLMIIKNY